MIVGFIQEDSKYIDVEAQKASLDRYAKMHRIRNMRLISLKQGEDICAQSLDACDTLVISNISLLGNTFENILDKIECLAEQKIYIYSVKEDLLMNLCNQTSVVECVHA